MDQKLFNAISARLAEYAKSGKPVTVRYLSADHTQTGRVYIGASNRICWEESRSILHINTIAIVETFYGRAVSLVRPTDEGPEGWIILDTDGTEKIAYSTELRGK